MPPIIAMLIAYLIAGLVFLISMYQFRSKFKQRIKNAPYELFDRFTKRGQFVSLRTVKMLMYPAIWLFWPFILLGMVQGKYEDTRKHRVNKGS